MAHSAKFYLKRHSKEKAKELGLDWDNTHCPIYLQFNFGYSELKDGKRVYKKLRYYIGEMIHPGYWDGANQRIKGSFRGKKLPGQTEFNQRLENTRNDVTNIYRRLLNDGIVPTPKIIKEELEKKTGRTPAIMQESVIEFLEKYNDRTNYVPGPKGQVRPMAEHTKKVYKTLLKHLKNFVENSGSKVDFDTVDPGFFEEFLGWLVNEKGIKYSSAGKYIKTLKSVLRMGEKKGMKLNAGFLREGFPTPKEDSISIYLTNKEIQKIIDLDLSEEPELDQVRDWFIIGCKTALRYGDLKRLSKENIVRADGGDVIATITEKTGVEVYSPFTGEVKRIFEKYNYDMPRPVSNQHANRGLKTIGELAGINDPQAYNLNEEGKPLRKYQLITTHTARRSCATNLYIAGEDPIKIMKITGHKSLKQLVDYIREDSLSAALSLQDHPYYQTGSPLRKVD